VPLGIKLLYWDFLFWKQTPIRIKMNKHTLNLNAQK